MPARTRAKMADLAYEHAIHTVLAQVKDTPLDRALKTAEATTIADILTMPSRYVEKLEYEDENGNKQTLAFGETNLIFLFQEFVDYNHTEHGTDFSKDWTVITKPDFDLFRTTTAVVTLTPKGTKPLLISPTTKTPHVQKTPAEEFKRGIKRDPNNFLTLKTEEG